MVSGNGTHKCICTRMYIHIVYRYKNKIRKKNHVLTENEYVCVHVCMCVCVCSFMCVCRSIYTMGNCGGERTVILGVRPCFLLYLRRSLLATSHCMCWVSCPTRFSSSCRGAGITEAHTMQLGLGGGFLGFELRSLRLHHRHFYPLDHLSVLKVCCREISHFWASLVYRVSSSQS
jgi:hypothetical protein